MKTYRIPVTHTAEVVIEHTVQAKNMQDAMFRLGQSLPDAPDPFECVDTSTAQFTVTVAPGSPTIVE